jgi:ElaB/YqjD/DUF883 family membrane-anchored ribosome-binding protein
MSSSTDIQRELEQTRSRMSAELDALAYKLDVPARAKERVTGAARKVRSAAPSGDDVKSTAKDNPLGIVLGGAAVGVLAGLLLPRTRIEDEKVGPVADRVRDEVVSSGREALERGKSVARQAGEAAKDAATDAAERQGEALKETATRRAQKVADSAR